MKIAVVGAGAMGCLFGGLLAEAGNAVRLITRLPQEAEQIQGHGVRLEGLSGDRTRTLPTTSDLRQAADAELIFLAVKAYDTAVVAPTLAAKIPGSVPVLTLQNGLGNVETLAAALGPERTLGGVTAHGATARGVGHVCHAGRGPTVIGEATGSATERTHRVADVLCQAGIATTLTDHLRETIWRKLMINVGINAIAALTQRPNGELLDGGPAEELLEQAVAEAVGVAQRQGLQVDRVTEIERVKEVCRATATNLNSMLQDLRQGRPTEIDFINGAIVRVGEQEGLPTPINRTLTQLVQALLPPPFRPG